MFPNPAVRIRQLLTSASFMSFSVVAWRTLPPDASSRSVTRRRKAELVISRSRHAAEDEVPPGQSSASGTTVGEGRSPGFSEQPIQTDLEGLSLS